MGLDVAGDLGVGGPQQEGLHEIHLSVGVAPGLDRVRDVLGHVLFGMVRQEIDDLRAGQVRIGGPVDGIAGDTVGQREIDPFQVGEPLESFPDHQVQVPGRDDLERGLNDKPVAPRLLVRPGLPAEDVSARRRDHQAGAGSVLSIVVAQETDPFEFAQRGADFISFLVAECIRPHVGSGTGQHAAHDLVQIHAGESHAQLKDAGQRGNRRGTRPFPRVPEGQQVFEFFRRGLPQPRFEFGRGPEASVFFTSQSAPLGVFHDEAHLFRHVLRRVRHAVRGGFLPLGHGIEGSLIGHAAVREPHRIVTQAVHEGKDVPDGGEVPALVFFRFRRFRLKETRQPVRVVADQHMADIFRYDEVDRAVRPAPADHESPGQQSVELLDQPGVGGLSRIVDAPRFS